MKTVEEIRRDWLIALIARHGTIAALNTALGRTKTDGTLSQIKNQSPNSSKGLPRNMGSELAREIELKLGMVPGTLDNPPLMSRLETADAATRALIEVALTDPDSPLPDGLSPSIRAMVNMARAAVREEISRRVDPCH